MASVESAPQNESNESSPTAIKIDPRTHEFWYKDLATNSVVRVPDEEYNSQQLGHAPSGKWPKFSKQFAFEEMPADVGTRDDSPTETNSGPFRRHDGTPTTFSSDDMQAMSARLQQGAAQPNVAAGNPNVQTPDAQQNVQDQSQTPQQPAAPTTTGAEQASPLTAAQVQAERARVSGLAGQLKDRFAIQAANIEQRLKSVKTAAGFDRIEQEIRESLAPGQGRPSEAETPESPRPAPRPTPSLDDAVSQFAEDHRGTRPPLTEDDLTRYRERFEREHPLEGATEGGQRRARAGEVASEGRVERGATRARAGEVASERGASAGRWSELPNLVKGAKELRQREIQANPELEKYFVEMVKNIYPEKGAEVYAKAVEDELLLNADDLAFLKYARMEFANRLVYGEYFKTQINPQYLGIAKKRNEAFRNEIELETDDNSLKFLKEQSMTVAMKASQEDMSRYLRAFNIHENNTKVRTFEKWQRGVEDVLRRAKVTPDEYGDVFDFTDKRSRIETRYEIERRIRDGRGFIERARDWVGLKIEPYSRFSTAGRIERKAAKLERRLEGPGAISEIDNARNGITSFLQLSLSHDPEVRRAFRKGAFRNENISAPEKQGATLKAMRGEREQLAGNATLSGESLQRILDRDKVNARSRDGSRGWNEMSRAERIDWKDNVWNPAEIGNFRQSQREQRGGFLDFFFDLLFGLFINRQKQQLNVA